MKLLIGSKPWSYSAISRVLRIFSFSTETLPPTSSSSSPSNAVDSLNLRIFRNGNPKASVVPILNQWVEHGRLIKPSQLRYMIRVLRKFRRYKHALQISEWMFEEFNHDVSVSDIAVKLDLIAKADGLYQAEKYFESVPDKMRTFRVYGALLECYAQNRCLEKAEATLKYMWELRFPIKTISYNALLSLCSQLEKYDKLDAVMKEMHEMGVQYDVITCNIRLNAYASSSDIEGMENFLIKVMNDVKISIDWHTYVVVANGYLKAGITEKALQMLYKSEQVVPAKSRRQAYEVFLTLYTTLERKDKVYRIWKLYKNLGKFQNNTYLCMISSLIKLDDLDGAEKILAEWELGYPFYDARIPNLMISAYCKRGFVEKAEAYVNILVDKGVIVEPDAFTFNSLATGYQIDGQMTKAVETMKKAILASTSGWKPNTATMVACLKFLEGENNREAAEELLQLLRDRGISLTYVDDRLITNTRERNLDASALDQIDGDTKTFDEV